MTRDVEGPPAEAAKQVFSLWPTVVANPTSDTQAMPMWARSRGPSKRLSLRVVDIAAGATLVASLAMPAVLLAAGRIDPLGGLIFLPAVLAAVTFVAVRRGRAQDRTDAAWRDTLFERTGISLWREDWSAVGEAILALKRAGVHDIEGHFAAHPEQARALRKRVIVKDVNAFAVSTMGASSKDELIGPLDRILPDSDQTFDQWLIAFGRGDAFYRSETHIVQPDGTHVDTLFTAALPTTIEGFRDILVTALDVTEYKAVQAKLVAAETEAARVSRISTMGAMTASIAHEVNTPLAAILANTQASLRWLRRKEPNLPEAEQAIERAVRDAMRTQEVIARTRAFLSGSPRSTQPVDLVETARIAMLLIDRELRLYKASVHMDAAVDLPKVMGDPIQMQQVLVNLMVNGVQAMKDSAAARDLRVTVRCEGGDIRVSVADRGPGIDPALREKLFDPFFSAKPSGMGMGLAICRTCVEAHGGRIWAESGAEGATLHFTLPAIVD